jgi:hypothetical protein
MQVSSVSEPLNDPFGDNAGKKQEDVFKPESSDEPTMPKDDLFESEPSPLPVPQQDRSTEDASPAPPSSTTEPVPQGGPFRQSEPSQSDAPSTVLSCENNRADCMRGIEDLQSRVITNIKVGLKIEGIEGGDYPCECKLGREFSRPFVPRAFTPVTYHWKATGVCHKPLYFEDVQLERYGHSWNPFVQPFMSGAHFFASVAFLPYNMGITPPNECIYTLGYYRPGSCAPYMIEAIPFSWRASLAEAFALTGFGFMLWP